jgi:hypothetical protein
MTKLTDEAVKALLDGATPGPWRADGEPWNRVVWSSADNRVCFMAHSNGLDDARDIATSNLAAAAPDLARALLDARAELAQARAEAQAAVARGMELAAEILAVRADVLLVDAGADAELVRVLDASVAAIRTAATSLRTGEAG